MHTYDAIISGYGPTGATLANLLGTMGLKVTVIEREWAIFDKPRAITAPARTTPSVGASLGSHLVPIVKFPDIVLRDACA